MSDAFNDSDQTPNDAFFSFFVFLFLAICICYCCRNESPADDPANDRIVGYFPNPSSATQGLEDRRRFIEEHLILKQVVAPEEPNDAEDPKISASTSSAVSSFRSERPMMERLVHSERTFSSYALAMKRISAKSSKKKVKFVPLHRAQSLPVTLAEGGGGGDEENPKEGDDVGANSDVFHEKEKRDDHGGHDHNHSHHTTASAGTIKHRRKCDIMARTLARTLSSSQDYEAPTECDICLLDYEVGEEVAWSNNEGCIHAFHKECITDWLLRNPKCPLCRRDYVVNDSAEA